MGDYYKEEEKGKREIKYDICAHVYVFDLVHLYHVLYCSVSRGGVCGIGKQSNTRGTRGRSPPALSLSPQPHLHRVFHFHTS